MKNFLLKALCLILLLATLFPMIVACNDDPPETDGSGEGEGEGNGGSEDEAEYLKLVVKNTESYKLVDLNDSAFLNYNSGIKNRVTTKEGTPVMKLTGNSATFYMQEVKDLTYARSISFAVYSEANTGATVNLVFYNEAKQGGRWYIEHKFVIDFVGWKMFSFKQDEMSGYGPKDKSVEEFTVSVSSGTIYISSVTVTKDIYDVKVPADIDLSDPAIYKKVTQNVRDSVIGTQYNWDSDGYTSGLSGVNNACKSAWDAYKSSWAGIDAPNTLFGHVLNRDDANASIWGNTAQSYITDHYTKTLAMAKGYATPGSAYYRNAELKTAIINCFEYGYKYYFGADFVEYGAYANWWNWQIGIPEYLHIALVLMEDALTPELCAKYLTGFDYLTPYPEGTGGNRIELARFCIISAALRHDAVDLCVAIEYMKDLFGYIDSYTQEGGFFRDYSFIQHFSTPYTNGYGGYYMNNIPKMLYYVYDTPFYPQYEDVPNLFIWVIEAFRPVMYKDRVMNAMAGRSVATLNRTENSRSYASNMVLMHYLAPEEYKKMLEPIIAEYFQLYGNIYSLSCIAEYADALYAKLRDEYVAPYEITKVFGMMSRVVHHGAKYGACLSISSKNITKFESFDSTNRVGWYHNDGMLQIYTDDYTFDKKFYSFANPYLIPGVTANSEERVPITHAPNNGSDYAGGINQGKYGSAGYINSYSGNWDSFVDKTENNVFAKKSYFFFDNEIVCVGSAISDSSGTEVKTTIDNRYWRSSDVLSVGGSTVSSPSTVNTVINSRTVHFTNMGGYVILKDDGGKLTYRKATNGYNGTRADTTSSDTYDFLELYINHGAGAIYSDRYFYAYLPTATAAETESYYANPDVALLRRTSNAHAVIEKSLGIVAANFFAENTSETVAVGEEYAQYTAVTSINASTPACVMVTKGENGQYFISVSDPTNEYPNTVLNITITGVTSVVSSDEGVAATVSGDTVSITVNTENSLRQTFNLTVR